jgi:muramoyltetrapeptide carboxypeptidase
MRRPRALSPGDDVVVIAPSGLVPRPEALGGMAWLSVRYRVQWNAGILDRTGYLAGYDARRARELAEAFRRGARAVFCARGGYGAMRILEAASFGDDPPWLVGFSDVTALHVEGQRHGVCTLHAPNVSGLQGAPPSDRLRLLDLLEGRAVDPWSGLRRLHGDARCVRGPAFGGNLALLHALAVNERWRPPRGAIVFLEDVTEKPYRVDRMLTSLRLGGWFDGVTGIVLGGFTKCETGPDGVTVLDVLTERTRDLGVPVLAGAPFGHDKENAPFVLGAEVTLDRHTVSF